MLIRTLAVVAGIVLGTPIMAQTLTVEGTGEVAFEPDIALVTLGVGADAATPTEAVAAMNQGLAPVLATLTDAGIAPRDMQTGTLNLHPVYSDRPETQPAGGPEVTGYHAESLLSVRVRDLDILGTVLDTVVGEGANRLEGVQWQLSDPAAARDAALGAAVADAVRKAAVMAQAAGVGLGAIEEIREGNVESSPPQPMMMMEARSGGVPLARGEVGVTAAVTLRYATVSD
ncbi:SIMPL domain-containing protein [Palleronia sp.]|uniref:SIMPL domain-containing protein n=1 Tax=Palleronia sp. TaxID=1940284 RepID=UPI0035C818E1